MRLAAQENVTVYRGLGDKVLPKRNCCTSTCTGVALLYDTKYSDRLEVVYLYLLRSFDNPNGNKHAVTAKEGAGHPARGSIIIIIIHGNLHRAPGTLCIHQTTDTYMPIHSSVLLA